MCIYILSQLYPWFFRLQVQRYILAAAELLLQRPLLAMEIMMETGAESVMLDFSNGKSIMV